MQQNKLSNRLLKRYKEAFLIVISLSVVSTPIGCKKLDDVNPPNTSLASSNVYTSDATAAAVLTGLYSYMSAGIDPFAAGINSISIQSGLSSDELNLYTGSSDLNYKAQYQNNLSKLINPPFWNNLFYFLYSINSAIEGLSNSSSLTPAIKQQLIGEAKFMRAFCNFYLVNLYGDIPLITSTDYKVNSNLARTPKSKVYEMILADLIDAQNLLTPTYVDATALNSTQERVRPNKWAATALLARTYLYLQKWDSAVAQASAIIKNSTLYSLDTLNGVFLKNSTEAIWQLQPVISGWNTEDARAFIFSSAPNDAQPVYLSAYLLNAFEPGDQRKIKWVDSVISGGVTYCYPFKYKNSTYGSQVTEYLMVLRLSEQYLIRAEAEAEQMNLTDAANDLNIVRIRAGLGSTTAVTQSELLTAIQHERQVELFTEWGHRWLDLKRTETLDRIMSGSSGVCAFKGGSWNSNWQFYPIPIHDIQTDINLTQNPGY